jgi:hypothetical protein
LRVGQAFGANFSHCRDRVAPRIPLRAQTKTSAPACVPAAKSPARSSRPGGSRTFDEYALLEDSRYMSQEDSRFKLKRSRKLRQFRGLRSVHENAALAPAPALRENRRRHSRGRRDLYGGSTIPFFSIE